MRTTLGAVVVVALALLLGGLLLVGLLRDSLSSGLESQAEARAASLVTQIEQSGVPGAIDEDDDDDDGGDDDDRRAGPAPREERGDGPDDTVLWVSDEDGAVVASSQAVAVPTAEDGEVALPGADHDYVLVSEDAEDPDGEEYLVRVAVSTEEVADSTAALVPLLGVGLPVLLLVVAGTTWVVTGRALRPVERMRAEVAEISDDRLDRRVPVPGSRDEVHRLALTMNEVLGRLESSRERQQRFVSDASHELRSPLASIRQTAEVSQAHPGALPEGELAEAVLEEGLRMQRIVEQMLVLTRADERGVRPREEVDLDDLVLGQARRVAREGLHVDTRGVGPARVVGDAAALTQVVRNLVDNAARHAGTRIAVGLVEQQGGAVLYVDDDGSGVPIEERERVFERFVRLDESRSRDAGGSGLGLAIVREIVRAHGGEAHVEDSPLGGARFVVRLPHRAAWTTG